MKKLIKISFILLLVISSLTNCEKDNLLSDTNNEIEFLQNDLSISAEGGEITIIFSAKAQWEATINVTWCSLSKNSGGLGENKLPIIISPNYTNELRTGEITIICNKKEYKIKIYQTNENFLSMSSTEIYAGGEGGIFKIEIISNGEFEYSANRDWISVSIEENSSQKFTNKILIIDIEKNNTQSIRKAEIVLCQNDIRKTINVKQEHLNIPQNYDFEVNGLFFNISSVTDLTVQLVGGEKVYSGEIVIPDNVEYNGKSLSVTSIGSKTFYHSQVKSVILGKNIKTIGQYAFYGSSISNITFPSSVSTIYERSFDNCLNLKKIIFENSTTPIKFYYSSNNVPLYFTGCPIEELYVGRNIDSWNPTTRKLFGDLSKLVVVEIGSSMTKFPDYMLAGASSLEYLSIPSSIFDLGDGAFNNCENLKKLIFEDGYNTITYSAGHGSTQTGGGTGGVVNYAMFCDSPLEEVYIGREFEVASSYALAGAMFDYTPIKSITIGKTVKTLLGLDFLRELEIVSIPENVTEITSFAGCNNLKKIYCYNNTPPSVKYKYSGFSNNVFANGILYVPINCLEKYQNAEIWKNFFNIQPIE